MRLKNIFPFAVVIVVVVMVLGVVFLMFPGGLLGQPSEEITWLTDMDEGFAKARQEGKYVMLYFYTMNYAWACQKMENEVFSDKQVIEYINKNFVCVKIDLDVPGAYEQAIPYRVGTAPMIVWLLPDGTELGKLPGVYTPELFIGEAEKALSRAKESIETKPTAPTTIPSISETLSETKMLLAIPETETGWVKPDLYLSPVYEIKPGQTVKHVTVYEKASPNDWATVRLLIRTCEIEGVIDYYVNDEPLGISYISKEVARGDEEASCCAMPWMGSPGRETVQVVTSEGYAGKIQFVFMVLIESPN